jgi:hypothetical protein
VGTAAGKRLKALAIALFATFISQAVLAASPVESRSRGPEGFGNIPYGSASNEAVRLNHGNGVVTSRNEVPVLTYQTKIQGLTFDVTQNYDKNRRAVDALALSTSLEPARACVARFNHVLALLQTTYGQSGSAPLQSRTSQGHIKYTVLIQFSRNDGIEAELTSIDPNSSTSGPGPTGKRSNSAPGPCVIRLHYLPPGWVGHF